MKLGYGSCAEPHKIEGFKCPTFSTAPSAVLINLLPISPKFIAANPVLKQPSARLEQVVLTGLGNEPYSSEMLTSARCAVTPIRSRKKWQITSSRYQKTLNSGLS